MAHIPFPASSPQLSSFGLFQDRDVLVHHPLPLPAPASKCRALSRCSMNVCEFVNARTQLLGGRGGEENATPALRGHGARMMGASALLGPQPHSGQSRACHGLPSPPTGHSEHAETPPPSLRGLGRCQQVPSAPGHLWSWWNHSWPALQLRFFLPFFSSPSSSFLSSLLPQVYMCCWMSSRELKSATQSENRPQCKSNCWGKWMRAFREPQGCQGEMHCEGLFRIEQVFQEE